MIIKSMSRKHASFSQLLDYVNRGAKSQHFTVYHNLYHRSHEQVTAEFTENAQRLKFRKNGVYLYHEVVSITRSHHLTENQQKEVLQAIVREYLARRAGKQLAYAVLHEDKPDNLHFHIVISANEANDTNRNRLSKAEFSNIQTSLEAWVLQTFPELEQKAVFEKNQTDQEKQAKAQKARISNDGAELKRRGGKTTERDSMKETIEAIFSASTNGRHFAELMEQAGLKLYQRGKNYGVTTEDGTKYRFATLGLAEAWEALDQRMSEAMKTVQDTVRHSTKTVQDSFRTHEKAKQEAKTTQSETVSGHTETTPKDSETHQAQQPQLDPKQQEIERRMEAMKQRREQQATTQEQQRTKQKNTPS